MKLFPTIVNVFALNFISLLTLAQGASPPPIPTGFAYSSGYGSQAGRTLGQNGGLGPVEKLGRIRAIATAQSHSAAVRADGTVWVWGENDQKQLGQGPKKLTRSNVPIQVVGLPPCVQVTTAASCTVVLTEAGELYGWGSNGNGRLRFPVTTKRIDRPVKLPAISGIKKVLLSSTNVFCLLTDGTIAAWGDNTYGELGQGHLNAVSDVVTVGGLSTVGDLSVSTGCALALLEDGTLRAWGYNPSSRLGTGFDTLFLSSPQPVIGLSDIVEASISPSHAVAQDKDHKVYTWGYNFSGELGNSSLPIDVGYCQPLAAISTELSKPNLTHAFAGNRATLITLNDKSAMVVGYTYYSVTPYRVGTPTTIPNAYDISAMSSADYSWMMFSGTDSPIWMYVDPYYVVGSYQKSTLHIRSEEAPTSPIDLAITSDRSETVLAATATIPAGTAEVNLPVEAPARTDDYFTATLTATTAHNSAMTRLQVVPDTVRLSLNGENWQAGETRTGSALINFVAPEGGIKVRVTTSTPTVGSVPSTITIPAGASFAPLPITTIPSSVNQFMKVRLSLAGHFVNYDLYIKGNPIAAGGFTPSTVIGGNASVFKITLTNPAPAGGLVVKLLQGGTEFTMPASVTIPEGETTGSVEVGTRNVPAVSNLPITYYVDGSYPKVSYLKVLPVTIQTFTIKPGATFDGGRRYVLEFTINGSSNLEIIQLKTKCAALNLPPTAKFGVGKTSLSVAVDSSVVTAPTFGTIYATLGGETKILRVALTPVPPLLESFTLSSATVTAGGTVKATVRLDGPAPARGTRVSLASANPGVAFVRGESVLVPEGATEATVVVRTVSPQATKVRVKVTASLRAVRIPVTLTVNP